MRKEKDRAEKRNNKIISLLGENFSFPYLHFPYSFLLSNQGSVSPSMYCSIKKCSPSNTA